jgi:hypothetical protein
MSSTLKPLFAMTLHSPASSFQRMPNEMWREVFTWCVCGFFEPFADLSRPPMLFTHVCRLWRQIALSMPLLWSYIFINGETQSTTLLSLWLQRSVPQPLTLNIRRRSKNRYHELRILRILLDNTFRWKEVTLHVTYNGLALLQSATIESPSLEILRMSVATASPAPTIPIHFVNCAGLVELSWGGPRAGSGPLHPTTPLVNLTDLSLSIEMSLSDCHAILQQCLRLKECRLKEIVRLGSFIPSVVHLTQLSILHLETDQNLGPLLSGLTVPSLSELVLATTHQLDQWPQTDLALIPWPQTELAALLTRSGCSLKKLLVYGLGISERDLIQCLGQVGDGLQELWIHETGDTITDRVIRMLTRVGPRRAWVGSGITNLQFNLPSSCTDGLLGTMAESICSAANKVLMWFWVTDGHPRDIDMLRGLANRGFDVQVFTES